MTRYKQKAVPELNQQRRHNTSSHNDTTLLTMALGSPPNPTITRVNQFITAGPAEATQLISASRGKC